MHNINLKHFYNFFTVYHDLPGPVCSGPGDNFELSSNHTTGLPAVSTTGELDPSLGLLHFLFPLLVTPPPGLLTCAPSRKTSLPTLPKLAAPRTSFYFIFFVEPVTT